MGVDFIQKTKRSFEKHLDVQRAKLGTSDLFTREPMETCQAVAAELRPGATAREGQELTAEISGKSLILRQGLTTVAVVSAPPAAIIQAVEESCGLATAVVEHVHEISGMIEVTLC